MAVRHSGAALALLLLLAGSTPGSALSDAKCGTDKAITFPSSPGQTLECSSSNCQNCAVRCADDQPCTIKCTASGGCKNMAVTCPEGQDCTIVCNQASSCEGMVVECPSTATCNVQCDSQNACRDMKLAQRAGAQTGHLRVACTKTESCSSAMVKCPGNSPCTIDCSEGSACKGVAVRTSAPGLGALLMTCQKSDSCMEATVQCPQAARCDMHCSTSKSCDSSVMVCPGNGDCSMICQGTDACISAKISAGATRTGGSMTASCTAQKACEKMHVSCGGSAACSVDCQALNSCTETKFVCVDSTATCSLNCVGWQACDAASYHCGNTRTDDSTCTVSCAPVNPNSCDNLNVYGNTQGVPCTFWCIGSPTRPPRDTYTQSPPTKAPDTAEPTVSPATQAPATVSPPPTAPETPAPATLAPLTDAPLTLAPQTSAPAKVAPATPAPATPAPQTSAPSTPAPATVAPATEAPPTATPPTPMPPTPAPATPAPVTAAPATGAPSTQAPPTAAPATPAPATVSPPTQAPATPFPATAAPATVAPPTQAPPTAAPATPAPATLAPATQAPATPTPQTATPPTSAPATPAPGTAAPATGVPTTSTPPTPAPATAGPLTSVPPTDTPTTSTPQTASPPTPPPATPSPPTFTPPLPTFTPPVVLDTDVPVPPTPGPTPAPAAPTSEPTQAPTPEPVPDVAVTATVSVAVAVAETEGPTPQPQATAAPLTAVRTASPPVLLEGAAEQSVVTAASSAALTGAGTAGRLALMRDFGCEVDDVDLKESEQLDFEFHPTGVALGSSGRKYMKGALLMNPVVLAGSLLLLLGVSYGMHVFMHVPMQQALGNARTPGLVYIPYLFLLQGTSLVGSRMSFYPSSGESAAVTLAAWVVLAACVASPAVIYFFVLRRVSHQAFQIRDPALFPREGLESRKVYTGRVAMVYRFVYGENVWVNSNAEGIFVEKYGPTFENLREGCQLFPLAELTMMNCLSMLAAWRPASLDQCGARNTVVCLLFFAFMVAVLYVRPYSSRLDNSIAALLASMMFVAVLLMTIGLWISAASTSVWFAIANRLLLISAMLVLAKAIWDLLSYAVEIWLGRKAGARQVHIEERLAKADHKAMFTPANDLPLQCRDSDTLSEHLLAGSSLKESYLADSFPANPRSPPFRRPSPSLRGCSQTLMPPITDTVLPLGRSRRRGRSDVLLPQERSGLTYL